MALTITQSVGPNVPTVLPGLLYETSADNLVATGNNQATAFVIYADGNRFTVVPAGAGCVLPPAVPGLDICIVNHGANALQVYGQGTDTIDDVAGSTGVPHMVNSYVFYECFGLGKWYTNGLGTGFPPGGSIETFSFADNLTATGTQQSNALPLMASVNRLTTVAAGTGVNLPPSAPGLSITLINSGANSVLVYPAQGSSDTINGFSATTGVPFVVNSNSTFFCTTAGAWWVLATQPANSVFNTDSNAAAHTLTGASITGAENFVCLEMTGALAAGANLQLPTVAQLIAALHSPIVGSSYTLRIINASPGAFSWTITTNTGWTLNGTMSIAQNTYREFIVTLTSTAAATLQSMGQVAVTLPV